jgi:hypothetical protein
MMAVVHVQQMPLSERCAASQSVVTTVSLELGEEVVLAGLIPMRCERCFSTTNL